MTTEEYFDDFLTSEVNLNKICNGECTGSNPDCDICLVTNTYKDLVDSLKDELKILPTEDEENKPSYFLTGSYRRHTMIRPPKDVDLFLVLDSGEYQDEELDQLITPTALIQKLKSTLEKIFEDDEDIEIKEQRHSVTVIYSETFSIDVIPAFETDDKDAYMIPDVEDGDSGIYIVSNPKVHFEYINQVNEDTAVNSKKRFKKVARLIKFVKRQRFNEKPTKIRSFHFELLAAKILGDGKINSYSEGLNKFFSVASEYLDDPVIKDPANEENMVDDYLAEMSSETKQLIKDELDSLYEITSAAVQLEKDGNDQGAIAEWKKVFYAIGENSDKVVGTTLGNTDHAKPLQWPFHQKYKVSIDAYIYIRVGDLKKLGGLNSNGRQLQDGILLKYIASTNASGPYQIKWQVVNTGPHAAREKDLRGNFFDAKLTNRSLSSDKHINWEHAKYTGKHWIECFVVKNDICVARSGRFYVNIKNRKY